MMKLLFVLGFPNPFSGAGWARIGFFANAWANKGEKIDVLGAFSYKSPKKRGFQQIGNINLFNLIFKIDKFNPICFILNSFISFIVTGIFIVARNPRITIVSVPPGDVGIGALMACKLLRTSYVVDYRDEWEDYAISLIGPKTNLFSNMSQTFYSFNKKLALSFYAKSKLVAAVTLNIQMSLKRRGLTKVNLIPNGADINIFKPFNQNELRNLFGFKKLDFIIIYSGGIGGYYRLDVAIRALKRVDPDLRDKIKLLLVGNGGELINIMHMAKELDLGDNVIHLGIIKDKMELAELLSTANVGLIPYDGNFLWKNSLPAKFFEYCACGLPVLATSYEDSLIAHMINQNKIGLISPPEDEVALAESIEKIFIEKNFRLQAGNRARLFVKSKYDRNKIAESFLNLLNSGLDE